MGNKSNNKSFEQSNSEQLIYNKINEMSLLKFDRSSIKKIIKCPNIMKFLRHEKYLLQKDPYWLSFKHLKVKINLKQDFETKQQIFVRQQKQKQRLDNTKEVLDCKTEIFDSRIIKQNTLIDKQSIMDNSISNEQFERMAQTIVMNSQQQNLSINEALLLFKSSTDFHYHSLTIELPKQINQFQDGIKCSILSLKSFNSFNSLNILISSNSISYHQLRTLHLCQNNIYSIQNLQFLNSPLLQRIYLNENKISSMKSISKIKSKNCFIFMHLNPIQQSKINLIEKLIKYPNFVTSQYLSTFEYIYALNTNKHYPTQTNEIINSLKITYKLKYIKQIKLNKQK